MQKDEELKEKRKKSEDYGQNHGLIKHIFMDLKRSKPLNQRYRGLEGEINLY